MRRIISTFCVVFLLYRFLWRRRASDYGFCAHPAKWRNTIPQPLRRADSEGSGGSREVARELLRESSRADAVCRARVFAARGGRCSRPRRKAWFWDGHAATTLARDVARTTATTGSNLAISESAPTPYLSADGTHLYWFSNQAHRLQRDGVDLSTRTTWLSWQTDLAGAGHQDLASITLPDCPCPTGGCEETCPYGEAWTPDDGVGKFFLLTQFVAGKNQPLYKATSLYEENAGKWTATPLDPPLRRVLDAANAGTILEAIPDTGCCGWENQSDDQTLLHLCGQDIDCV